MKCDTKVWHILVTNSKWTIKIIFDPTFTSYGYFSGDTMTPKPLPQWSCTWQYDGKVEHCASKFEEIHSGLIYKSLLIIICMEP